MGHGAQATRRGLIDKVKECLEQTNAMTLLASEVREAHNTLAKQTGEDVAALTARLDTLSAWCKKLEAASAIETRRHTLTRSELAQMTIERDAFVGLTFWGRLRWILAGGWTKPGTYAEVTATVDSVTRRDDLANRAFDRLKATSAHLEAADQPRSEHPSVRGYIPHTSLGPRVLP